MYVYIYIYLSTTIFAMDPPGLLRALRNERNLRAAARLGPSQRPSACRVRWERTQPGRTRPLTPWWRTGELTEKPLNMAIETVDFPMKNGGSFHSYGDVYQRVVRENQDLNYSQDEFFVWHFGYRLRLDPERREHSEHWKKPWGLKEYLELKQPWRFNQHKIFSVSLWK